MVRPRTESPQVKRLKTRVRNLKDKLAESVPKTELESKLAESVPRHEAEAELESASSKLRRELEELEKKLMP